MKNNNSSPKAKTRSLRADESPNDLNRPKPTSAAPHGTKRSTGLSAVRPIPRRGLSREEAAMYLGISASKFDELVRDGRMPRPKRIDSRKIWDVRDLDVAFDALPAENPQSQGTSWDDFRDL
jgi:predicted DNA-binding transcriptional regulator AlpA